MNSEYLFLIASQDVTGENKWKNMLSGSQGVFSLFLVGLQHL